MKFLTLKEVAVKLRVSDRSIFRYIHAKRLRATKVGYWRIAEKDLRRFLKENLNTRKK